MSTRLPLPACRPALMLVAAALLAGCGALRPGFETPTVTVSSFRTIPSEGALPEFEIGLRVTNPNREALKLRGVSYTVSLNDRELINGVANDLPVIEGYGQGDVILTAAPNLVAGIRFVSDLVNRPGDTVSYRLEARLDPGALFPTIRVTDSGEISLGR
ncbi:MAG: LEA type 2 family protein [Woeseiaceae bacterium]|nr:LEA type 2 family protein [Woeseiaceae bacterium]